MSNRTIGRTGDQSAALEFLARRESYDPRPDSDPVHIATHGSHVFLAGERAYKIKRAVSFPYMDFGTLAQRKRFTEAELELNRRTAPDLYLGIRRLVRRADGTLGFDGDGETVEWVLEMRRFEQDALLDVMAETGTLTAALIERTAERVREFHERATSLPPSEAPGAGAAGMKAVIEENFEEFAAQPDFFDAARVQTYARHVRATFEHVAALLEERTAAGYAKHCHGDLHLRNICLIDGEPTLFDGIEFNPTFACIDVLYDLAYFLSDLEIRGRSDFANLAFNRYFIDGGYEGLACMPLFLSTRSAVRAKIMVSGALAQDTKDARNAMLEQSAHSFEVAEHQIEPAAPVLIAFGGFSGSGKSTIAREVAYRLRPSPGAVHLRSDAIRKRLFDTPLDVELPPEAYKPQVSEKVYDLMLQRARLAMGAGYPVILDAVNDLPHRRAAIAELAAELGVSCHGFWLDLDTETMARRIAARSGDVSDATEAVMRSQAARGHGPLGDWISVDASGSVADTLAPVLDTLGLG